MKTLYYKIKYQIISILVSLLPYFFVKFRWYRRLIYCHSFNQYQPLHLSNVDKFVFDKSHDRWDVWDYVELWDLEI